MTEVLDGRGELSSAPGAEGELVGTGFMNAAMPFIRYRLGDHARIEGFGCARCGRAHRSWGPCGVVGSRRWSWAGRVLRFRSPRSICTGRSSMASGASSSTRSEPGRVTLRLVAASSFGEADVARIQDALVKKTGDEVAWSVETVIGTAAFAPRERRLSRARNRDEE